MIGRMQQQLGVIDRVIARGATARPRLHRRDHLCDRLATSICSKLPLAKCRHHRVGLMSQHHEHLVANPRNRIVRRGHERLAVRRIRRPRQAAASAGPSASNAPPPKVRQFASWSEVTHHRDTGEHREEPESNSNFYLSLCDPLCLCGKSFSTSCDSASESPARPASRASAVASARCRRTCRAPRRCTEPSAPGRSRRRRGRRADTRDRLLR